MKRFVTLLSLLMVLPLATIVAESNYQKAMFTNYIEDDMDKWPELIDSMEKNLSPTTQNQLEILSYYYGLIGHYLNDKEKPKAEAVLDKAKALAKEIGKRDPQNATLLGLDSNIDGYRIAVAPYKAPFLAKDMQRNAKKAIADAPNNPYVNVLYANMLFYMPALLGGDEKEGLAYYEKALGMMEKDPYYTQNNWLYPQLITTIGLVYEKMGNYPKAEAMFNRALKLEPDFKRLKTIIMPRLQAAIAAKK